MTKRKIVRKIEQYSPSNTHPAKKPEWILIEKLRSENKRLTDCIVNDVILKQKEMLEK